MSTPILSEEQTLNPSYTKDQPSSSSPSEHSSTEQQQPTSHPSQSEEDPSSSSSSVVIPPLPKTWLTTPTETYLPNLRKEHYAICRRTLELYPDSRICGNCMKPARQVRLKYCVECRGATYCSRECQRADWKLHRSLCVRLTDTRDTLRKMDELNEYFEKEGLPRCVNRAPAGLTWVDLNECARKWMIYHEKTLFFATVHALRVPNRFDFTHFRSHIVYICVGWREDNVNKEIGKYFGVIGAEAFSRKEAAILFGYPVDFFDPEGLRGDDEDEERGYYDPRELHLRGEPIASIALALECRPLKQVLMIPYSCFLEEIWLLPTIDWKEFLENRINNGKPF
ncbi:hypothetical protein AGABI2DRAFT_119665 [Agaricus bisporus var. bisporus H97]|uniref:hypothetical protein n=1 Tax=Agaricus bisporus var. bisporus (strain H97 / ATCC MYA-4626 / FGSC 10389) TaxID=936046 RepID=UPI00029F7E23|nr:hypothetical protein AGABI2DRAFT_119665 [Agaricus bisporus var. bisporus H97]EKV46007.1 hypothetical protein AGABI2DRAFT_119665 [Agaricus bisporus var. bisporus H97]